MMAPKNSAFQFNMSTMNYMHLHSFMSIANFIALGDHVTVVCVRFTIITLSRDAEDDMMILKDANDNARSN